MKIIVAPTSLSPASLHAVTYAAELAHLIKAHLHLIHVYPAGFLSADVLLPEEGVTELAEVVNRKMYSLKENLRKKFYSSLIVHLRTLKGDASAEINKYCEKVNAYAVVLTLVTLQGVIFGVGILILFMDAMNAGYSLERTRTLVFLSLVLGICC